MTLKRIRIDMPPDVAATLEVWERKRGIARLAVMMMWLADGSEQAA